ncbi:MAG: hypothetical protein ACTJLM_01490 [Ehrlichia sp.]
MVFLLTSDQVQEEFVEICKSFNESVKEGISYTCSVNRPAMLVNAMMKFLPYGKSSSVVTDFFATLIRKDVATPINYEILSELLLNIVKVRNLGSYLTAEIFKDDLKVKQLSDLSGSVLLKILYFNPSVRMLEVYGDSFFVREHRCIPPSVSESHSGEASSEVIFSGSIGEIIIGQEASGVMPVESSGHTEEDVISCCGEVVCGVEVMEEKSTTPLEMLSGDHTEKHSDVRSDSGEVVGGAEVVEGKSTIPLEMLSGDQTEKRSGVAKVVSDSDVCFKTAKKQEEYNSRAPKFRYYAAISIFVLSIVAVLITSYYHVQLTNDVVETICYVCAAIVAILASCFAAVAMAIGENHSTTPDESSNFEETAEREASYPKEETTAELQVPLVHPTCKGESKAI